MTKNRRKYDISSMDEGCVYAHERLDKIEPKIDRLSRLVAYGMAGVAITVFLAANHMLDLSSLVRNAKGDEAIAAEVVHDNRP